MRVEEIISDRIVKLLEAGTVPWHKPWANRETGDNGMPRNAVSKRQYRGINVFILLEDLKAEIIDAKRLAADENGTVLVWTGAASEAGIAGDKPPEPASN
jgi:hypothetical protein